MAAIKIQFVKTWNIEEVITLYRAGGWWKQHYSPQRIPQLIKGSFIFAVAVDTSQGKTIGMGRVLSDGVSDGYIQDVVVLENYRHKGIGKRIIDTLVAHCRSQGLTWIGLIAEPHAHTFYEKSCFKVMKEYIPMLFQEDDSK